MSLNYTSYTNQLSNLMVVSSTDANFTTFEPGCIDYAEQRLYRELDLLNTRVTDTTTLASSTRTFSLPTNTGTFIVVEEINVLTPAGAPTSSGTRSPLQPVTKEFIDAVYPSAAANTGTPAFYAPITNTTYLLGPSPNGAFTVEVIGTQRPTPLSASNSSTFLTQYCPDLFMAASMVFAAGYMRDFGAESDDPRLSQSWENQYQMLKQSADLEQLRSRYMGSAWTPMESSPVVTPPRA